MPPRAIARRILTRPFITLPMSGSSASFGGAAEEGLTLVLGDSPPSADVIDTYRSSIDGARSFACVLV
jgi:hypothetical protein